MKPQSQEKTSLVYLVEHRLSDLGWNQAKLVKLSGVNKATVSRLLSGSANIGSENVYRILSALNLLDQLSSTGLPNRSYGPIPVISWNEAGSFAEAVDSYPEGVSGEGEPVFTKKKVGPNSFALRVEGESMLPRFMPGDVIIVDPDVGCENGNLCVVKCNDEVTFKQVKFEEEAVTLKPLNPRFPDTVIRRDSAVDFQIIGRVVDMVPNI